MKVNLVLNRKNEIIGYIEKPLDYSMPIVDKEEIPQDLNQNRYKYDNNAIVKITRENSTAVKVVCESNLSKNNQSYNKQTLLDIFNEYKNKVYLGLVKEDEFTHKEMVSWYNAINNDDINAINNPPKIILKYMEGTSWI